MRLAVLVTVSLASCAAPAHAQSIPHEAVATVCSHYGECVNLNGTVPFASGMECETSISALTSDLILYLANAGVLDNVSSAGVSCVPSGVDA